MLKRLHPLEITIALCILLLVVTIMLFGPRNHTSQEETTNDVHLLQSNGDFWFSNDTAYFVKKGVLNPSELRVLETLAYEKEVVVFCDI